MTAGRSGYTRGYSSAQVRAAERPLLDAGVPLMARAAAGLAAEVLALLERRPVPADTPPTVLVLVGSGDNGGDALYASAHLAAAGVPVVIVPTADRMHPGGLATATGAGARVLGERGLDDALASADVVVDGILGIGARGGLRGRAREVVEQVLEVRRDQLTVVAVDLPSGADPDTGAIDGPVLPADVTVTFGAVKAGLLLEPAAEYSGRIHLVEIGLDLSGVEPAVQR